METQFAHNLFDRRFITKSKAPAVKWFREWVPQDVVATGGKCKILKWVNEETLRALKEKAVEPEAAAKTEPEPTTEVLFLCSYDGCGKTFIDAGALRKHSHVHGEKQHVCRYEGCGKKFLDSSKLKRHFLTHTGERDYVCPVEGCGKAFSLDFNLRSHMKTHSQENYHVCPFPDCGKRYAYEYKLKNHISAQHEKIAAVEMPKYAVPLEKTPKATKPSGGAQSSAPSVDRPYACPYEGCEKAYIHEYKLKLHFKNSHNGLMSDENPENEMDEASGRDAYGGKRTNGKNQRQQSREKPNMKIPPSKAAKKSKTSTPSTLNVTKKPWPLKEDVFEEGDSEETEEDRDNVQDGWMHGRNNEDDDEETEYED